VRLFGAPKAAVTSTEELARVMEDMQERLALNARKMADLGRCIREELKHGHDAIGRMLTARRLDYRDQRERLYRVLLAVEKAHESLENSELNQSSVAAMKYVAQELTRAASKVKVEDVHQMHEELDAQMREAHQIMEKLGDMHEELGPQRVYSNREILQEIQALQQPAPPPDEEDEEEAEEPEDDDDDDDEPVNVAA